MLPPVAIEDHIEVGPVPHPVHAASHQHRSLVHDVGVLAGVEAPPHRPEVGADVPLPLPIRREQMPQGAAVDLQGSAAGVGQRHEAPQVVLRARPQVVPAP